MVEVLVVDDFATTRAGLRAVLEKDGEFQVVGEAADGPAAVVEVGRLKPQVVILDLGLPGIPGADVALRARRTHPDVKIVVQTMYADEDTAVRCFQAGVHGYILKQDRSEILVEAIHRVLAGERFVSPALSPEAVAAAERRLGVPADAFDNLTERETEVLRLTAQGLTSRETARHLGISHRTVEAHRSNLMVKLGLKSQRELVRCALRRGLVS